MSERPTVVLLHGLARTHRMLGPIQRALNDAGYPTWARTYPSRTRRIEDLAQWVADAVKRDVGDGPVFAVTHSLGGILVRFLADALPWTGAVLCAPPNAGSRAASALSDLWLFQAIFGPAGQQLAEAPDDWPAPPRPFAVIAGVRSVTPANPPSLVTHALRVFPGGLENDGTVAVDETRHPLMSDFATVDASHTWIMHHPRTREMVLHFLEAGALS